MPSASCCPTAVLTGSSFELSSYTPSTLSAPSSPHRQPHVTDSQFMQVHNQMLLAASQPPHVYAALYSDAVQQQQALQQEQQCNALLQQCLAAHSSGTSTLPNGAIQHVMPVSCAPFPSGAYDAAAGMLPFTQSSHSWLLQQAAASCYAIGMGPTGAAAQQHHPVHPALCYGLDPHAMAAAGFADSQAPRQRRHSHLGFAQPTDNRRRRSSMHHPPTVPQQLAAADAAAAFVGMAGAGMPAGGLPPAPLAGAYAARARRSSWCPPSNSNADLAMRFANDPAMPAGDGPGVGMMGEFDVQPQAQELQQLLMQRRVSEPRGYSTSQPGSPSRAAAYEAGGRPPVAALQYGLTLGGSPPACTPVPTSHHAQQQQQQQQQQQLVSSLSLGAVGSATAAELQQALRALSGMAVAAESPVQQQRRLQQQRSGGVAAFWQRKGSAAAGSAASSLTGTPMGGHVSAFDQLIDQQVQATAELSSDAASKAAGLQEHWSATSPPGRTAVPSTALGAGPAAPWQVDDGAAAGRDISDQQLRKARLLALLDTKRTLAALAEDQEALSADVCGTDRPEAGACGACQPHSNCGRLPTQTSMLVAHLVAASAQRRRNSSSGSAGAVFDSSNKVFVGNIGWWVTEEDLLYWFGKFGTVTNVKIMYNSRKMHKPKDKWRSREYGFVDFSSHEEASRAIAWMDGVELAELMKDNSGIIVQYAKPTHD